MTNDSIKLAKLWTGLNAVRDALDNELIPLVGYLGVDDPELVIALEDASARIENHLKEFRLVAEAVVVSR